MPEPDKIVQFPAKNLNQPSEELRTYEWGDLGDLVYRLRLAMRSQAGIGIAAPQIGVNKRVCIVRQKLLVNPVIVRQSEETESALEGCLSVGFGGQRYPVRAPLWVDVEYQDLRGKKTTERFEGLQARIVNHETWHLAGKLINEEIEAIKLESERISGESWE